MTETRPQISRNLLSYLPSALFIACSLIAIVQALGFPSAAGEIPGPALFPLLLAVALGVMGIALAVQTWRKCSANGISTETELESATHPFALPGLVVCLVTYTILMPWLGFISTTVFFLYVCLRIFGHRGGVRAWAFAFGTSYVLVFIFAQLMNVPLPSGWVG